MADKMADCVCNRPINPLGPRAIGMSCMPQNCVSWKAIWHVLFFEDLLHLISYNFKCNVFVLNLFEGFNIESLIN